MAEIEKLDGKSMDIVEQNIEQLKELFPSVFSEGKIKFNQLEELLGNYVVDDEDHYNFTWHGKRKAGRLAQTPSTGTLRPCKDESVNWDSTENLFIEGDNLEVLKLLQKSYHRQVKMIYIDPPYNTGNDFVYEDDFKDGVKNYLEMTGQLDSEGKKMGTNSSSAGRYHTNWLNMMYPRLKLARNLLRDDGVIFISINDCEQDNLRKLCNEIFGEENFVANLIWSNKEGGGSSDTSYFRIKHEYIICYAKNISRLEISGVEISNRERYTQADEYEAERGPFYLQKLGMGSIQYSESLDYEIETPDGGTVFPKDNNKGKKACWRWSKKKFEWGKENGFIVIQKDSSDIWTVYTKQYLSSDNEGNKITRTQRPFGVIDTFSSTQASKYLDSIQMGGLFDYTKPHKLIEYLIKRIPNNDLILDFFAGSGTTAHAVMKLNAEDGGNRKCISVQLPELTYDALTEEYTDNNGNKKWKYIIDKETKYPKVKKDSEARKSGYYRITELSKERIRRTGKKIKEENPDYKGGLGFKVFKLDTSNIKRWEADFDTLETDLLGAVDYLVEGRSDEDVLYELCLKLGLDLTIQIEEKTIAGKKVSVLGRGYLVVCLDNDITMDLVNGIGALKEELAPEDGMRVVFKDAGFADEVVKTNALQTLKRFGINDIKSL